ncbi:cytochrome b/b6 domain-containing protein [Pseudohaliea rubra]|uniref:Cytochrome b561 bacterial/Ni-hydrogenase domain-containing protein n=1 Tax=Pseudohaliea rubra DSM 19751 TaxID=1265313 RepID=A0A095VN26_9GAMM|nr:cytochrome b/b6 domain-containing protein [Pseudohaliea rubra]KGE02877.1 hypothetical protein HRUBRA_02521 [Pseudohaliea rubra DSM 19751]
MTAAEARYPLWDLPVRVSHWLIALCLPAAWWTAEEGHLELHAWIGYTVLTLVLARLAWGVFGSPQARFADFLRGPGAIIAYLREGRRDTPGHNPLGGWSAMLLWSLLLVQALTGLYNSDGILFDGPLYHAADEAVTDKLGAVHGWLFNGILAFVGLHVAAVLFYQWRRGEQLLVPMVRGSAPGRVGTGPAAPLWRALLILDLVALALLAIFAAAPEPVSSWW